MNPPTTRVEVHYSLYTQGTNIYAGAILREREKTRQIVTFMNEFFILSDSRYMNTRTCDILTNFTLEKPV